MALSIYIVLHETIVFVVRHFLC